MIDAVDETLRLWRRTVFQWGTTDCCLSAADYVLLVTGSDPVPEFRNVYDSETEAARLVENAGLWRYWIAGNCCYALGGQTGAIWW